ncbi:MAG: amidohydrolase family protein, partial [Nitrospinota bacterium]
MGLDIPGCYVLPVDSRPLKNGLVSISGGKIIHIGEGRTPPFPADQKKKRVILIPGLVNAHTHLDLTGMGGEVGKGKPFTDWILEVIAWRAKQDEGSILSSIKKGIAHSLRNGTTCLGDFSATGDSFLPINETRMKGRVFFEVTGFQKDVAPARTKKLKKKLANFDKRPNPRGGIAPHSPYSVSPGLIRACVSHSRKIRVPVSMHVAEVQEEIDFLAGLGGKIAELQKRLSVWESEFVFPGTGAVEYLRSLGVLEGMSLVHLNHISAGEVVLMRTHGCTGIFCPGSHLWFQRKKNKAVNWLFDEGVNLALGTDGLSSNESLDMFREMRLFSKMFPEIPRGEILKMATINGAKALSLD